MLAYVSMWQDVIHLSQTGFCESMRVRVCEDREVWGAARDTGTGRERVCGEEYVHVCVEKRE